MGKKEYHMGSADAGSGGDILIAYPMIGEDKLRRLLELHRRVKVTAIVNSVAGARGLSNTFEEAKETIDVLIEMDGGLNRGGLKPEAAAEFAEQIRGFSGISVKGLMYYGA